MKVLASLTILTSLIAPLVPLPLEWYHSLGLNQQGELDTFSGFNDIYLGLVLE
jgi:hypothetical protein